MWNQNAPSVYSKQSISLNVVFVVIAISIVIFDLNIL